MLSGSLMTFPRLAAASLLLAAGPVFAQQPKKPKPAPRHEAMEYGPILSATIGEMPGGKGNTDGPKGNNAHKGIAVKLNAEGTAAVCFDTDLCRLTAGWTGGFLHLRGTAFDTSHGSWPAVKGDVLFRTKQGVPGWAKPGTDDFKDPRAEPYGPLPRDWAKYRGLYLHGNQVVFKYTVGEAEVLELPAVETKDGGTVFTLTFNVSPTKSALTCVLAEEATTLVSGIAVGSGSAAVENNNGRHLLKLPASDKPAVFTVFLGGDGAKVAALAGGYKPADLAPLTKGGPARWAQTIETKGVVGTPKNPNDPYVVDTLTLPEDNPWKSWFRLGGMDFFKDGKRAAVSTWSGDVWVVSGIDAGLEKLVWKRYAVGLYQPLGLRIVDDVIYVNGRDQITRLHDLNGDGEADFYECFNNDHTTSTAFHEFVFDLQTDPEGNFYYSHAGGVNPGGRGFQPSLTPSHHGTLLKVSKDGSKTEVFATGFRAPNGIGVGPDGTVTSGDNEGTWMPMCRVDLVTKGSFQGCAAMAHRKETPEIYDPPVCWMPKNVDNSGGGQTWVTADNWGLPKGTLLHTSYGTSSLYHVLQEKVDGTIQGGVVRTPVQFATGIMRPRFNASDGQLYIAGLKGWQTNGARDGAFHRVRFTGKPYNTVLAMHVTKTGLELTFSHPLDAGYANDANNYGVERWNYLWREDYGSADYKWVGPEFDAKVKEYNILRRDRAKNKDALVAMDKEFAAAKGHEPVTVKSAKLSPDGKTVTLELSDVKPVMQMRINVKVKAADAADVKLDIYGTINKVP